MTMRCLLAGLALTWVVACGSSEAPGGSNPSASAGGAGGGGGHDEADVLVHSECEGPLGEPRDPAELEPCCEFGEAHCLESVPSEYQDFVSACPDGDYCVPDVFIASGGIYTPPPCASLDGAPGVCLSRCIPKVAEVDILLPQDICAPHEKCAPCVSPIDGMETGACDFAFSCEDDEGSGGGGGQGGGGTTEIECPYEGPALLDPSALPECPSCGGGHCLEAGLIPDELQAQLASCGGTALCVPDEFIESAGNSVPDTCESVAGAEGRCLSTCLPAVAEQADLLPSCGEDHVCVPCYDPFDGTDTGACALTCDPGPTEPPVTLPECCAGEGTCVPAELVEADQVEALGQDVCPPNEGLVCAPNALIDDTFVALPCEALLIGLIFGPAYEQGVCLPDCLAAVDNPLLAQEGCPNAHTCAPCLDPTTGQPSGACDL